MGRYDIELPNTPLTCIGIKESRREDLKAKLAAADAPPPLLHPEMAELYRQKVTTLAQARQDQKRAWRPQKRSEGSSTPSS